MVSILQGGANKETLRIFALAPSMREHNVNKGLSPPVSENNLIHTMARADRNLIEPHLTPVKMDKGMVVEERLEPIRHVYFPRSGVGSTVAMVQNGRPIEVGLFGNEGMSGTAIVMQSEYSSQKTFMQIPGDGWSIDAERLRDLLGQSTSLQRHFLRYVQSLMTQVSHTALSNGHAKLEERLARWLLMCHDRIKSDKMSLTHEFMSIMLGVRRAGVTVGIHILEGKGMIRAYRGQIIILDRKGLESEAHGSYGAAEAEYARLIGFDRPD
ncbi:Crp/Fnr family transcriptional regulator [Roseovarius sp. D22-M7]|uniref:Crp/Fnr family transcriptional regulator n=1 Tax=Roseovarius sp. D22-M7 TaxID=3127116 RepID=UPI0030105966